MGRIGISLWLSFFICFFSNVFAGLISTLMPTYLPIVVRDLGGSTDIAGIIVAVYIGGWTIGGFTWGFISDKIGRKKAIALSVITYGVLTLLLSFASSWEAVVAIRLLSGFACGGILVITPTLLSEIWPASSRSVVLGIDSIGFPPSASSQLDSSGCSCTMTGDMHFILEYSRCCLVCWHSSYCPSRAAGKRRRLRIHQQEVLNSFPAS